MIRIVLMVLLAGCTPLVKKPTLPVLSPHSIPTVNLPELYLRPFLWIKPKDASAYLCVDKENFSNVIHDFNALLDRNNYYTKEIYNGRQRNGQNAQGSVK